MKLSPNFTLKEMLFSETAVRMGIENRPSPQVLENLKFIANELEEVRKLLRAPVIITSGYRCPKLNALIPGSSPGSFHTQGLAVDFICRSVNTEDVFRIIHRSNLVFDKLIWEGSWIHMQWKREENRWQSFRANFTDGKKRLERV